MLPNCEWMWGYIRGEVYVSDTPLFEDDHLLAIFAVDWDAMRAWALGNEIALGIYSDWQEKVGNARHYVAVELATRRLRELYGNDLERYANERLSDDNV